MVPSRVLDIVFMTPRTGVYICEQFCIQSRDAVHEEEKVKLTMGFTTQVKMAQQECNSMKTTQLSEFQGS